jgi:osmotically-inducible protein OsmY
MINPVFQPISSASSPGRCFTRIAATAFAALGLIWASGCRERGSNLVHEQGREGARSAVTDNYTTGQPTPSVPPAYADDAAAGGQTKGTQAMRADASGGATLTGHAPTGFEANRASGAEARPAFQEQGPQGEEQSGEMRVAAGATPQARSEQSANGSTLPQRIRQELTRVQAVEQGELDPAQIEVEAAGGRVVLFGTVPSTQIAQEIVERVEALAEVDVVENRLEVWQGGTQAAE